MPQENPNDAVGRGAEKFKTSDCLRMFDNIPGWRQSHIDSLANNAGFDSEVLRNMVEDASEDPEKSKRIGEILTVISESTRYSEEVENNLIPEKIKELIELVQ